MNTYEKFFSKQYDNTLKRIDSILNGQNKNKLLRYIDFLKHEEKTSDARIISIASKIIAYCKELKKPLANATRQDAQKIVKFADSQEWTERTRSDFKATYKQYRKWLADPDNAIFPSDVSWIRKKVLYNPKKQKEVTYSDIMKTEDYKKFISACDNPRDKAMFGMIGELGLRPKEAIVMKLGSIDFSNSEYVIVNVPADTKTGFRAVPAIFCKKWLREWCIKYHPEKHNKEAFLFTQLQRYKDQPISYKGLHDRFEQIKKRAGLDKKYKKFTLYQFRKFSYTFKASKGWSDQQIKAFHGLKPKSKAIDVYVKIDPKDLVNPLKELYGLKTKKVHSKELTVILCPNCGAENPDTNKNCEECGLVFDITEANKLIQEKDNLKREYEKLKRKLAEIANQQATQRQILAELQRRKRK